MSSIIVFMYHGLYRTDRELASISVAEQPYAISVKAFEGQLDYLSRAGIPVLDPSALQSGSGAKAGVVLTFDDGHLSNFSHAMPILKKRELRAAFFVTSDLIGERADFCRWQQVREMADEGMLIGSHGRTHHFFDDMTSQEAESEFLCSKEAIEQEISRSVRQISFPGGRYRSEQIAIGTQMGYDLFYSSRVGVMPAGPVPVGKVVNRIAIRQTTTAQAFGAIARGNKIALLRAKIIAEAKRGARNLIGNRLYHQLYEHLSRRHR